MADSNTDIVTQTTADQNGSWQTPIVTQNVSPGLHQVTAVAGDGSTDHALLFVDRPTTTGNGPGSSILVQSTTGFVPPLFAYAMFLFLLLIIILAVNGVRLGRHADLDERGSKGRQAGLARHRHARHALVICILALALAFYVGVIVNQRSGAFDRFLVAPHAQNAVKVSVAGAVVTPFGNEPVAGVDLVAGDTAIRTDASGQFSFSDIDPIAGIRLTQPFLTRALQFSFMIPASNVRTPAVSANILFDADMYDALIARINDDARNGRGIFSPADVSDQTLVIASATADAPHHTVTITVRNGADTADYALTQTGGAWTVNP